MYIHIYIYIYICIPPPGASFCCWLCLYVDVEIICVAIDTT